MKLNGKKCHLMIFGGKSNALSLKLETQQSKKVQRKNCWVSLWTNNFLLKHICNALSKKASQKLHALSHISYLLDTEKLKHVMRAFILSQFSYCPLVWIFCNRHLNNKTNNIHKKALSIAYKDNVSYFDALLIRDSSVPIHKRNLQLLMTEIYKTTSNIAIKFYD